MIGCSKTSQAIKAYSLSNSAWCILVVGLLKDSVNGEYHFLRLSIQEHAPEIVKYRTELEADKQYIIKTFKNLLPAVQQAIIEYSKNSIILHPQDFWFLFYKHDE